MQVLKPATPNDNFPKQFCLQLVYCSLQLLPILFPHYLPGSSCNGEGAVREECPKFPAYGALSHHGCGECSAASEAEPPGNSTESSKLFRAFFLPI